MKTARILLIGCLLLAASGTALAADKPIIYTVEKGDTLWGISQRFIKDPYYWPNLWSHNPSISNPHLIYPGQKLRIYDGRIEIIPVEETEEMTDAATAEELLADGGMASAPDEVKLLNTYGGARSFIDSSAADSLGTLVDAVDNRVLLSEGEKVFLEMHDLASVAPGQRYELLELGEPVKHPVTQQPIGFQTAHLGYVEIAELSPTVAVGIIRDSTREIQRGARLLPYTEPPLRIPRKAASVERQGYIVAADGGMIALSQLDVIHIDIGAIDGLEVGNELAIYRPRTLTKSARPIKQMDEDNFMVLPDIQLGKAIVIDVRGEFAAALILEVDNLPIYRGDLVTTRPQ